MSVFQNSFDWFESYLEGSFLETLGIFSTHDLESNLLGPDLDQSHLAGSLDFDPFAWMAAGHHGSMDLLAPGHLIEAGPAEVHPDPVGGMDGGFHGHPVGSPADHWLTGAEWSGSISSGTIDTSGQGNHVISCDGEVLNLP